MCIVVKHLDARETFPMPTESAQEIPRNAGIISGLALCNKRAVARLLLSVDWPTIVHLNT